MPKERFPVNNDIQLFGDEFDLSSSSNPVDPLVTPAELEAVGSDFGMGLTLAEINSDKVLDDHPVDAEVVDGGQLSNETCIDTQSDFLNENHSQVSFGCLGICSGDCIDSGGFAGKSFSKVH